VGSGSLLRREGFVVHARVGRQFASAVGIVKSFGPRLPKNVVIELGTNGTVRLADCVAVIRAAGPRRRVFLVNVRVPRAWQERNNTVLRQCDRSFPRARVRVIHWHRATAEHPEWLARDGYHTSDLGRRALAAMIDRHVDRWGR
jgi:hypothetical protein